jgi:hypothetical protein
MQWDFSDLLSRCRHCRQWNFTWLGHFASLFLRPFAPPELPGFVATMDALTPVCDSVDQVVVGVFASGYPTRYLDQANC